MPRRYKQGADGQPHPAFYGKLPEEFSKADTISRFLTTYTYKKPIRIGGVEKTKGNFFNNKKSLTKS